MENIYILPGISKHREKLTVLLTGSRAFGAFSSSSDVDIDVLCSREDFQFIQEEMIVAKKTSNIEAAYYRLPEENWTKYFGGEVGRPHFSIHTLEEVKNQYLEYQDIPIWIWNKAIILNDPNNQFKKIREGFGEYPKDVLLKKIKYRYLLANYWLIDGYPHNHTKEQQLFTANLALLNGINELYKFFYLVEGKPYPYSEHILTFINETKLGKRFKVFLDRVIRLTLGTTGNEKQSWERLDKAIELILYGNKSPESTELFEACDNAMREAGIDESWIKAGYDNIEELLKGSLGPIP